MSVNPLTRHVKHAIVALDWRFGDAPFFPQAVLSSNLESYAGLEANALAFKVGAIVFPQVPPALKSRVELPGASRISPQVPRLFPLGLKFRRLSELPRPEKGRNP